MRDKEQETARRPQNTTAVGMLLQVRLCNEAGINNTVYYWDVVRHILGGTQPPQDDQKPPLKIYWNIGIFIFIYFYKPNYVEINNKKISKIVFESAGLGARGEGSF